MTQPLSAASQVYFHQRLAVDRQRFVEPLESTIARVSRSALSAQISRLVPADVLARLVSEGIEPALVFPTPIVIAAEPALLGYYRLLIGISKKSFYDDDLRGQYRSTEEKGTYTKRHAESIEALCECFVPAMADLVRQIPSLTIQDLLSLPLMTMGAQYEGAWRVLIGQRAETDVFAAIYAAVEHRAISRETKTIVLTNEAGETVRIVRKADPDVAIERECASAEWELLLAMEIKGGSDRSNAHNRAGEADKSHSKTAASALHWTVAMTARLDAKKIAGESSRTDEWFDVEQVRAQDGPDWDRFRQRVAAVAGISVRP